ncbi:hypothetical protein FRC12_018551 [Ceratobasidium sp. 428]|nr:hypothetical protein FRC12_018551 [Ceratobasidium sp. 428]
MLDSNNEDDDEDDDAYRGINFQPENSRSHRVNKFLLRNSLELSFTVKFTPKLGLHTGQSMNLPTSLHQNTGTLSSSKEALDLFARPDIHQLMKHFPGMFL